jgi:YHS domain-containing protein
MAKVDSLDKDQIDPVCGMRVAVTSPIWFDHAGSRYYFCCKGCRERFSANPQSYLNKPTSMATDAVMVMPSFKGAKISVPVIDSPMQ